MKTVLHTEMLDVTTPDGVADAYLARPAEGRHPGVLLCMDAMGLRRAVFAIADRIAAAGHVVLAPNLLYRFGRAPIVPLPDPITPAARSEAMGRLVPLLGSLTPDVVRADATAYLDALAAMPASDGPVGTTGYCMGGTFALQVAGLLPDRVAAVATFHAGHLATASPDSPHRRAGAITAELHLAHASDDPTMPADAIVRLEQVLAEAGVAHRSEVYPGAHGFTMVDHPAHDAPSEARHWQALDELFGRVLRGA